MTGTLHHTENVIEPFFFKGIRICQHDEWLRFGVELEERTPHLEKDLIDRIKTDKSEAKLLSLFGAVLIETLESVSSMARYQLATWQKVEFNDEIRVSWQKNTFILSFYKALYPEKEDLLKLLGRNEIAINEGNLKELKTINSKFASVFEELFIIDNPEGKSPWNVLSFLDSMLLMEEEDTLRSWEKYVDTVQECVKSKDEKLKAKVTELFALLEARRLLSKIEEGSKLSYVYEFVKKQEVYQDKVLNQKVWVTIRDESKIALQAADWYYNAAIKSDYGIFDAGLISLAYFRVIEVELNIRIIWQMLYTLRYKEISKQYKKIKAMFSHEEKIEYQNKWVNYLQKLSAIDDYINGKGSTSGFELGPLRYFLEKLRTNSGVDPLADTLCSEIEKNMTDLGKEAYRSGRIEEIISKEVLDKYRNPPAHTRYLPLSTAKECREYVLDRLLQIDDWFIVKDNKNIVS